MKAEKFAKMPEINKMRKAAWYQSHKAKIQA
jgi:hypothetical protein